jgi:hypothetical protein
MEKKFTQNQNNPREGNQPHDPGHDKDREPGQGQREPGQDQRNPGQGGTQDPNKQHGDRGKSC